MKTSSRPREVSRQPIRAQAAELRPGDVILRPTGRLVVTRTERILDAVAVRTIDQSTVTLVDDHGDFVVEQFEEPVLVLGAHEQVVAIPGHRAGAA